MAAGKRKAKQPEAASGADRALEAPLARRVPQSIEAERALLGAILIDSARVLELCAAKRVVPEAFVEPAHRCIYTAMMHLSSRGMPVDAVTLGECLRGMQEEAASAVGLEMLSELVISTPTSAHAGYYIGVVMEQYLRRQILGAMREIEERVYDPAQGADYVLGEAEQAILAIGEGRTQQGSTVDWKTSVGETLAMLTRQLDSPGQLSGLSTGFKALDEKTRGMHKGAMIVLAARPAMGKTSLAMNVAECVARGLDIMGRPIKSADGLRHKHTVLVFSLEMPQVQLTTRMLCGMAEVSAREVERGQFVKKEVVLPRLNAAARELADTPILCDDQGGLDVLELRARARHTHKKTPLDLIVIDYLQLLGYREYAAQGQQVMVSKISGEIKAMAKELNVPVLVLSQLSRNSENRNGDERPRNSDLRDSGAIEQDADMIWLLRRPSYMGSRVPEHDDRLLAIVDVSKNRNGATGEVRLNFDGSITRFKDRIETNPEMMGGDMEPVDTP